METLVAFLFGSIVGWTIRSFVSIPEGQVMPFPRRLASAGPGGQHASAPRPLRGKLISCNPAANPAPAGKTPKAGLASDPLFHWCYLLAAEETAGDVAAAVTGAEARYQELLLANPDVPKVGTPGMVGASEWNFAPGSLAAGARLALPMTWNPWIDELGNPRMALMPFQEDTRAAVDVKGEDGTEYETETYVPPAALMEPLRPHEPAPYGRAFSYGYNGGVS